MVWYKAAWIDPFFAALNTIAPNRDRSSDGTIGDLAHMTGTSGHNPDDTPGVKAERQDADSKPEVRAADAGSDLRSKITMQDVVAAILGHPDRDRLIYVIHRGKIYRKAGGWRAETYTGSDQHYGHVHLSGDPTSDDDGRPWRSILNLGRSTVATAAELAAHNADSALYALNKRQDSYKAAPAPLPAGVTTITVPNVMKEIEQTINETKALVVGLQAGQPSDAQWALLLELIERLFAEKVGEAAELGAAAALARTRLVVDAPPAPGA